MAKLLQHNIEAIHRLITLDGNVPVVIFTRDELSEETMLPSGKFEIFWYMTYNDQFYGSIDVIDTLDNIEKEVERMLEHAKQTLHELKTKTYAPTT